MGATTMDVSRHRQAVALSERVYWVGALDPSLRNFDVILKTANGTTYNAYLIKGSESVAIVDTVKEEFSEEFFARLESQVDYADIHHIILNHLEPDHSGALPELMRRAPQAELYISLRAQAMLKGLLKRDVLHYQAVTTGDAIDLGDRTIRFLHTPFLHWPDTQCSYLDEEGMLFSGDVFGCHFCDARLFNDLSGDFRFSFEYYFEHIMRPFKKHVLKALELIEPLDLQLIAPTHGPILRQRPRDYVRRYRELSVSGLRSEVKEHEQSLLIFYISAYGNTARMAEAIYAGASEAEGVRVSLYDLQGSEISPLIDLIEDCQGIIIGSPTINGDAVKPIWDLLSSLAVIDTQGKFAGAFGSFGWSGEAVHMIEDRLRGLKMHLPLNGVRVKLIPTPEELQTCHKFGRDFAEELVARQLAGGARQVQAA
jgi:NADH oxidase (H2O-forming)